MMINYFQLPDFNTEDKKIKELLSKFIEHFEKDKEFLKKNYSPETIHTKLSATAKILVNAIKQIVLN